jgi:hypothetical protein
LKIILPKEAWWMEDIFPGDFNTREQYIKLSGPREWLFIFNDDYSATPNPDYMTDILNDTLQGNIL